MEFWSTGVLRIGQKPRLQPAAPAVGAFGLDFPESFGQPGSSYRSRDARPLIYLAL
jgi:hypothetical protein